MFTKVDRVVMDTDENWTTHFIPWLENNERNNIGTEDGVFVATVNAQLRILQPHNEDSFVKECVANHLSKLTGQKLKRFSVKGLYHLGSRSVSEEQNKAFQEQASCLQSYKGSTCCTELLERDNGLELMLKHLFRDIDDEAEQLRSTDQRRCTTSQVFLEDIALKLRNKHKMLSESSSKFSWEGDKNPPPKQCPDIECSTITDSADSDASDMEDGGSKPDVKDTKFKQMYGYDTVSHHQHLKITNNLNLSRIYNILWLLPDTYGGLHSSYLYFGARHALFSVHVEDGLTWSLNYLHIGHPKVWVVIPPWATDLLDYHLYKSGLYLHHSKCRNVLGHKVLFPTTDWLKERGIPYKIVVQHPGDLVILYPNAAHFGVNLGNNIAEAVNVGTVSWIPWGINAKKCTCFFKTVHLNVTPLVAAFREDLLPAVLQGRHVLTPFCLRGIRLLHDEVAKMHGVHTERACGNECDRESSTKLRKVEENEVSIECPSKNCSVSFSSKGTMMRHVKKVHKPILEGSCLLEKVERLFAQ